MSDEKTLKDLFKNQSNRFLSAITTKIPLFIPGIEFSCTDCNTEELPGGYKKTVFHFSSQEQLEADYICCYQEDTNTVEISGTLRNNGSSVCADMLDEIKALG